jgi:hypothetical protein
LTRIFGILFFLLFFINQLLAQGKKDTISVAKTIFVAQPTGNDSIDRNLILTALNKANKGDTIQFAEGDYLIGNKIQIDANSITLRGNSAGTVISGCKSENFTEHLYAILNCGGFELIGQNLTIENFTFEYAWHGLMIGCCLPTDIDELESGSNIKESQFGGHIIQRNIFRFNSTGIRVIGINPRTVVIRDNVFQDNFHGLTLNSSNVSVKGNRFYTSNPEKIPIDGAIDNAIGILPFATMFPSDNQPELNHDCEQIEIIGNIIENIKNDIRITDSKSCGSIIIKDNTIKK